MCGIAGMALRPGMDPPPGLAATLAQSLAHRGPDGRGAFESDGILLVQTRLAIIDLETGRQPLFGPDGTVLVANGEIYNYRELRAGLPEATFATQSDCEPPLWLYARDGLAFADTLRGMYAIALWDPAANRLVLARDPFGIKPLYFTEHASGVAFASEPQALLAAGLVERGLSARYRDQMLQLQFSCGGATVFPGIRRVLPGETLVIENGHVVGRRTRQALPPVTTATRPDDPEEALDRVLAESIDLHQRSDVPFGLFLSGGIDSSAVLALMARLNETPVLAFTAGFPGTSAHDERDAARDSARAVGATAVDVPVTEQDFLTELPAIAAALDDPVPDYAVVPTWMLARRARQEVKVVLCGEGGDEMFGGYGRYRAYMRPWPWHRPLRRTGLLDGFDLFRTAPKGWRSGIRHAEDAAKALGGSRLVRAQRVDCTDWLPHDLLTKLDRCLMAHGVEGRVPFLDPEVAAFALPLEDRLKVRDGKGKWVVRSWLSRHLPDARPFAPKRGFTVPVGAWIGAHGDRLGPLVAEQAGVAEACKPDMVRRLFRDPRGPAMMAAWVLLFFALWHRHHVLGAPPVGDVFDTLSTAP